MMKYSLCSVLLFVFWPHTAQAAITPHNGVMCRVSTPGNQTCEAPALTVTAGDTITVFANAPNSYNDTYGISDSCSQIWTPGNAPGSGQFIRWWYVRPATAGSCVITVTHTAGINETWGGFVAQTYSGVTGIGANTGVVAATSTTNCSGFMQITAADNYIVGGFGINNGSNGTGFTPTSGTIRVQSYLAGGTQYVMALLDHTASVVGNLSMGVSWSGTAGRCSFVMVELNSAAPPPALVITPPPCTGGTIGQMYSCILTANGGVLPYTWSITSGTLPSGLTLSSSGAIGGTPTAAGSFSATAQVGDSATPTAATATATVDIAITGRMALSTDALHNILFASAGSNSYVLPGAALSVKNDWCAWVIPTGSSSNTYDILPQSTQLNGQSGDIVIPSWQMTRVCQDDTGKYWANPPLVAGNGVTIASTPTRIIISALPAAGGAVNKIAGGTYSLTNENFAANTCVLRPQPSGISAPGVQATDVVILTRQSSASGWGQGRLKIDAIPFAGTFSFEICNADMSNAINPASPLLLNWLVVR